MVVIDTNFLNTLLKASNEILLIDYQELSMSIRKKINRPFELQK
jgi:hypothetical protein